MPRIPDRHLEQPQRKLKELRPGERAVVLTTLTVHVDEERRAWMDGEARLMTCQPLAGVTLQAERTQDGFILWLDKRTKFNPQQLARRRGLIPVIEFREAEENRD